MSNEVPFSEATTHVPLLKYEDEDSLIGFGGSRVEGMADADSLEGHVITVVNPSKDKYLVRIIKKPVFWLAVLIFFLVLTCICLGALLSRSEKEYKSLDRVCQTPGCLDAAHYMLHAIDPKADPCDDFFQYSCGGWIKDNPIPDSEAFWGTFSYLWQSNMKVMKRLITDKAIKNSTSTSIKLAKTFYDSCMDMDEINKLGARPLHKIIKDVGGWSVSANSTGKEWSNSSFDFSEQLKKIQLKHGESVFFSFGVNTDSKNSSSNIIEIDQAGLGIERNFYLKNQTDENLVAYLQFMTTVGILLGGKREVVEKDMKEVLELETKIAKIFVPPNNRSQIDQMYRKMTIKDLSDICPKIPWLNFFQEAFKGSTTIKDTENVVVLATDYLKVLSPVIMAATPKILNNYMIWQMVSSSVSRLSKPFREASYELHKVLDGVSQPEDLWKTCISETDDSVGMALGSLFVNEKFEGSSRTDATKMINDIRAAFKERLPFLDWMDEETRRAAIDKADAVINMIGYPQYIHDFKKLDKKYEALKFSPTEYFANLEATTAFSLSKSKEKLRKEVDRNKWLMTPQTVNAYYNPSSNQIVFPAGILQAPYYDKRYPKYCNYGSIGGAVGHELVHGFDNSGRMYDKYGNFGVQWWTNKSVEGFQSKADCLIKQYDQYSYYGKHEKGKFTLGENIADNGGLKAAYLAYQNWIKQNGQEKTLPVLGKTNDQLFFIAYGQSWCASIRPEKARSMLEIDPHSPNKFRVLGTLSNLKEFANAFSCPLGSKMNPPNKCVIW